MSAKLKGHRLLAMLLSLCMLLSAVDGIAAVAMAEAEDAVIEIAAPDTETPAGEPETADRDGAMAEPEVTEGEVTTTEPEVTEGDGTATEPEVTEGDGAAADPEVTEGDGAAADPEATEGDGTAAGPENPAGEPGMEDMPVIQLPEEPERKPSEAEKLFGEGAMYLDEFKEAHPGAKVYGMGGIMPMAIGGGWVDPGWFLADVALKSDPYNPNGPHSMSNASWPATLGLTMSPASWSGARSGGMSWNELGFLNEYDLTGYPRLSASGDAGAWDYAVASITVGDTALYNIGVVEVDDKEYLWVSADRDMQPDTAVVLPYESPVEKITLHYEPLEYAVTYSVVDAGAGVGVDEVFGTLRAQYTSGQRTMFSVTIPEGYYATVTVKDDVETRTVYPVDGEYGNFKLGADPAYDRGGVSGPGYFSRSEAYYSGAEGSAHGTQQITVTLEKRTAIEESYDRLSGDGVGGKTLITAQNNPNGSPLVTQQNPDGSWTWVFEFYVHNKNYTAQMLDGLYINEEGVDIPYVTNSSISAPVIEECDMSTGEHVKVEIWKTAQERYLGINVWKRYYRVTITNAYRDLIVTSNETADGGGGSTPKLVLSKATGVTVQIYRGKNSGALFDPGKEFKTLAESRNIRVKWAALAYFFQYNDSSNGGNVSATLKDGWAWPGAGRDDTSGTAVATLRTNADEGVPEDGIYTVNNAGKTVYIKLNEPDSAGRNVKRHLLSFDNAVKIEYQIQYLNVAVGTGVNTGLDAGKMANFSLDSGSMPFDPTIYNRVDASLVNFMVPSGVPKDTAENAAQFRYWVLTDANGNPVSADGSTTLSLTDPTNWVKIYPGNVKAISTYAGYWTSSYSGFENSADNQAPRHTMYLTAYWKEPVEPYTHFVTFNTVADKNGDPVGWFTGTAYERDGVNAGKATVDDIGTLTKPKTEAELGTSGKIRGLKEVVEFNLGDIISGEITGAPVTIDKDNMIAFLGDQAEKDGKEEYKWYTFHDAKNNSYKWDSVADMGPVDLWFLYTLGDLKWVNTIAGHSPEEGLPYEVIFTLPADNVYTAGNEAAFENDQVSVTVSDGVEGINDSISGGKLTVTGGDQVYKATIYMRSGDEITFSLPEGTQYSIRLLNPNMGANGRGDTDGYVVSGYDNSASSTVWKEAPAHTPAGFTLTGITETKMGKENVNVGYKSTTGIVAYDTQVVNMTTTGTYAFYFDQATNDPTTAENWTVDSNLAYVENYHHLSYITTVKNVTAQPQDITVTITFSNDVEETIGRLLNFEMIGFGPSLSDGTPITWNPEDIAENIRRGTISSVTDGEASWEYNKSAHTLTFTQEGVEPGKTVSYGIRTSVPAVRTTTEYTGSAALTDKSNTPDIPTVEDVTAKAFSYWLRIISYNDDPADPEVTFTVKLDDSEAESEAKLGESVQYMLFESDDVHGLNGQQKDLSLTNDASGGKTGTLTLKNGQRVVIYQLTKGVKYTVTSNGADKGYAVYKDPNDGEGQIVDTPSTGTDDSDIIVFHFKQKHDLKVTKEKTGSAAMAGPYNFNIELTVPQTVQDDDRFGTTHTLSLVQSTVSLSDLTPGAAGSYTGTFALTVGSADNKTYTGIPEGATYKVTETGADDYTTTITGVADEPTAGKVANGTVGDADVSVTFNNDKSQGSVSITKKVVSDVPGDATQSFTFTVTLKDAAGEALTGSYTVSGTGTVVGGGSTISDGGQIQLTNGQTAKIEGLPLNAKVTVAEAANDLFTTKVGVDEDSAATGYQIELTIAADSTDYPATFINTRKGGLLTIKKVVEGAQEDVDDDTFKFVVTLNDMESSGVKEYGDVTFTNGVSDPIALTNGGTKTLTGVPQGLTYTVTESMDGSPAHQYATAKEGDTGTTGSTVEVTFANYILYDLTVNKAVAGTADNSQDSFTFTVELTHEAVELESSYDLEDSGSITKSSGDVYSGITLKGGESATIQGVPYGASYKVEETEENQNEYTTSYDDKAEGTIEGDTETTVTNTRNDGSLTITKAVENGIESEKDTVEFPFTVTLSDSGFSGSDTEESVSFVGGVATFSLKDGESITFEDIPYGTTYTVAEGETAGYEQAKYSVDGSETPGDGDATGSISYNKNSAVTVTNQPVGVTITKAQKKNGGSLETGTAGSPVGAATGDQITYVITVQNREASSKSASHEIKVTDTIPEGLTLVPGSISDSGTEADGTITWNVSLADTEAKELTFTVTVPVVEGEKTFANTASMTVDSSGAPMNSNTEYTKVAPYWVRISKTLTGDGVEEDAEKEFTFTVTFGEDISAKGPYYYVVSEEFSGGVLQPKAPQTLNLTGDKATLTLKGGETALIYGLPDGVTYTVAETAAEGYTTTSTNVSGTIDTTPETAAFTNYKQQKNSKAADKTEGVNIGDELVYTITWVNNEAEQKSATITDTLPTGLQFVKAEYNDVTLNANDGGEKTESGTTIKYDGSTVTWTFTAPATSKGTVTVTVKVTEDVSMDGVTNSATIKMGDAEDTVTDGDGGGGGIKFTKVTLSYNANQGTGAPSSQMVVSGTEVQLEGSKSTVKREDFTFIGWYEGQAHADVEDAETYNSLMGGSDPKFHALPEGGAFTESDMFTVDEDITLYAVWATDAGGNQGEDGDEGDGIPDFLQKTYKVEYNGNGGAPVPATNNGVLPVNGSITVALDKTTTPVRDQAYFLGWSEQKIDDPYTKQPEPDPVVDSVQLSDPSKPNTTVYAVWAEDLDNSGGPDYNDTQYELIYNGNGETTGSGPADNHKMIVKGYKYVLPYNTKDTAGYQRDGAVWVGWTKDQHQELITESPATLGIELVEDVTMDDGPITLYALWAENLDAGDGDDTPDYEQERYIVHYDKNGADSGEGNLPADKKVPVGTKWQLATVETIRPLLKKDYATFIGWALNQQDVADVFTSAPSPGIIVTEVGPGTEDGEIINVYAAWAEDLDNGGTPDYQEPDKLHKLTYNANGGTGSLPSDHEKMIVEGGYWKLDKEEAYKNLEKARAVAIGWSKNKAAVEGKVFVDDSCEQYVDEDITMGQEDIEVYAVWAEDLDNSGTPDYNEQRYKLTYDRNGGTGDLPADHEKMIVKDHEWTLTKMDVNAFTKPNAVWVGWSEDPAVQDKVYTEKEQVEAVVKDTVIMDKDKTVYAVWAENLDDGTGNKEPDYTQERHKLTYDRNGGGGELPADNGKLIVKGGVWTLDQEEAYKSMSKTQAVAIGWSEKEDKVKDKIITEDPSADGIPQTTITMGESDMTVWAVWAENLDQGKQPGGDSQPDYMQQRYELTYDYNEGENKSEAQLPTLPSDNGKMIVADGVWTLTAADDPADPTGTVEGMLKQHLIRDKAVLIGWSENEEAVKDVFTSKPGAGILVEDITMVEGGKTVYAAWAQNLNQDPDGDGTIDDFTPDYEEDRGLITYNPNGGITPDTLVAVKDGYNEWTNRHLPGEIVTLWQPAGEEAPWFRGYGRNTAVFIGWTQSQEDPATVGDEGLGDIELITTVTMAREGTLDQDVYAVWAKDENGNGTPDYLETDRVTLKYDNNGGDVDAPDAEENLLRGSYHPLANGSSLTKGDAIFVGWSLEQLEVIQADDLEQEVPLSTKILDDYYQIPDDPETKEVTVFAVYAADDIGDGGEEGGNKVPDYGENYFRVIYHANGGTSLTGFIDAQEEIFYICKHYHKSGETGAGLLALVSANGEVGAQDMIERENAVLIGWTMEPQEIIDTITPELQLWLNENLVTYVNFEDSNVDVYAVWATDSNHNGIPDGDELSYVHTYLDNMTLNATLDEDVTDVAFKGTVPDPVTDVKLNTAIDLEGSTIEGRNDTYADGSVKHYMQWGWSEFAHPAAQSWDDLDAWVIADGENDTKGQPGTKHMIYDMAHLSAFAIWVEDSNGEDVDGDGWPDGDGLPDFDQVHYTLYYDSNNGDDNVPEPKSVVEGGKVKLATSPLPKYGKNVAFAGWSEDPSVQDKIYTEDPGVIVTEVQFKTAADGGTDITVYAVWAEDLDGEDLDGDGYPDGDGVPDFLQERHKLTYDFNGGTASSAPIPADNGKMIVKGARWNLADPTADDNALRKQITKTQAVLVGWSASLHEEVLTQSPADSGITDMLTDITMGEEDITVYAVWAENLNQDSDGDGSPDDFTPDYEQLQYLLRYDANDGTGTLVEDKLVAENSTITLALRGDLVREGFTFLGWSEEPLSIMTMEEYEANKDIILAAGSLYKVTAGAVKYPAIATMMSRSAMPVNGGIMPMYMDPEGGTITLYAAWAVDTNGQGIPDYEQGTYRVIYDTNGGNADGPEDSTGVLPKESDGIGDTVVTLDATTEPTKEKAVFLGWSVEEHEVYTVAPEEGVIVATVTFPPVAKAGDSSVKTVYAVWGEDLNEEGTPDFAENQRYTLTYDGNGGKPVPKEQKNILPGLTVALDSETIPVKDGAVFLGWSAAAHEVFTREPAEGTIITEVKIRAADVTVYAVWAADENGEGTPDYEENTYLIHFELDGGKVDDEAAYADKEYLKGIVIELPAAPKRSGYTFAGWRSSADEQVYQAGAEYTVTGEDVLTAVWKAIEDDDIPTIRPSDSLPGTGDTSNFSLWLALLILSILGLILNVTLYVRRNRRKSAR